MQKFLCFIVLCFCIEGAGHAEGVRFYGDLLLSRGIEKYISEMGKAPVRASLAAFLQESGLRVVNLEGAVGDNRQCEKGHDPCFPIDSKLLDLLSPFDVVSLQNNHSLDLGLKGLHNSLSALKRRKITALGGTIDTAVLPTESGNVAILAVTDVVNAPSDRRHVSTADSPTVFNEIKRLKKTSTIVAVYVHWGKELEPVPTKRMKELARKYIEAGADLVVGAHPHVVGNVECVQGKPVVYSLGNFLFDQKYEETKHGAILDCNITGDDRLACRLLGHQTAFNSYLPEPATGKAYEAENAVLSSCAPEVERKWSGVFSEDRSTKTIILKREKGRKKGLSHLELYAPKSGKKEAASTPMPILKLQPVDLNGDGVQEIMLIQNIYSSLDKEVAKRVYIYSFNERFHALWRGSALSRPLVDAVFVEYSGHSPLLIALHTPDSFLVRKRGEQDRIIMSYRWNGFGFNGVKELRTSIPADEISFDKGSLRLQRKGEILQEVPIQKLR